MYEQFFGDGYKLTFDLREIPTSIHDMTARVLKPLHPIALVIGNYKLETFAAGYDVLVDRLGKRISLEHALPPWELLLVEYPFDDPNQAPARAAAQISQDEPRNVAGWEPWDYQNWRDFAAAMHEDRPIAYAICVWLLLQESNEQAFQGGEWSKWYRYAKQHCPRFDREQPKWRE
jgi:hypothetical protein